MTPDHRQSGHRDVGRRIAEWISEGDHDGIRAYTLERLRQSASVVPKRLADCPGLLPGLALDVGCGSAFDTFALAAALGAAHGVDVDRRAVREGRRIASRALIPEVTVVKGNADVLTAPAVPTLVWCNIMSHNVTSRLNLFAEMASALPADGWLVYAEACEGYPLLELERSIRARNVAAVRARLRQAAAGLSGSPAFRFFVSGSARPALEQFGFDVTRVSVETDWRGVPVTERVWARKRSVEHVAVLHVGADYVAPTEWLNHAREVGVWKVQPESAWQEIYRSLPALATATGSTLDSRSTRVRRAFDRLPSPLSPAVDWARADAIINSWSQILPEG